MQSITGDEVWKPIKGYEGRYEISNMGRIKSKARKSFNYHNKTDRILSTNGRITIRIDNKNIMIDVVVAETFINYMKNKLKICGKYTFEIV
jgi:hypothetical protein